MFAKLRYKDDQTAHESKKFDGVKTACKASNIYPRGHGHYATTVSDGGSCSSNAVSFEHNGHMILKK